MPLQCYTNPKAGASFSGAGEGDDGKAMSPRAKRGLLALSLALISGCSALPGLSVLTGADSGEGEALRALEAVELVMADKTGATDPSLLAAADRIEAASVGVDIIEIRRNLSADALEVSMLFLPPEDANTQNSAGLLSLYSAIQRAMELTWRGTVAESEGSSTLRVHFISPREVSTLDSGPGLIGFVTVNSEIERVDALSYLRGPRGLNDFLDLIAAGTLSYENPQGGQLYSGEPNHPLFLLNVAGPAGP